MSREVVFTEDWSKVHLDDISDNTPIFVTKYGKLVGMVVMDTKGWIIRLGNDLPASWYSTRLKCLEAGVEYKYEYFTP